MEEIKELFTVTDALSVERKLQVFFKRLQTIVQALKNFNGTSTARELLKTDIEDFKRDVKVIPDLLVELHFLIIGKGVVAAGRTSGLACDFVDYLRRKVESDSAEKYNLKEFVQKINNYRENMMRLQVNSFQLRNNTCSSEDLKCQQEAVQLEEHLQAQDSQFRGCVPKYLKHLGEQDNLENIHIVHSTLNQALYSKQKTSIVKESEDILDWDKIDSPQEQGLKCLGATDDTSVVWSLVKATGSYQYGYNLKQESGCFLSFDKQFIDFKTTFPTFWADNDRIDKREFLVCLHSRNESAASFLLYAISNKLETTYHLKEVSTGKYLHVHVEKTNVLKNINRRLVLVLLLAEEKSNSWILAPKGSFSQPCDDPSPLPDQEEDFGYIWIIVGCCAVVVVVVVGLIIWYKIRQKRC